MECPQCHKSELATKQTVSDVTPGGVIGVALLLGGGVVALSNVMLGGMIMVVGLLIGLVGRRTITTLVCPACRYSTRL